MLMLSLMSTHYMYDHRTTTSDIVAGRNTTSSGRCLLYGLVDWSVAMTILTSLGKEVIFTNHHKVQEKKTKITSATDLLYYFATHVHVAGRSGEGQVIHWRVR